MLTAPCLEHRVRTTLVASSCRVQVPVGALRLCRLCRQRSTTGACGRGGTRQTRRSERPVLRGAGSNPAVRTITCRCGRMERQPSSKRHGCRFDSGQRRVNGVRRRWRRTCFGSTRAGFEHRHPDSPGYGSAWTERRVRDAEVVGSNPTTQTSRDVAQGESAGLGDQRPAVRDRPSRPLADSSAGRTPDSGSGGRRFEPCSASHQHRENAMARTIAKELDNRRDGDRRQCSSCNPRQKGVIRADRLWAWSLDHPGESPFRDQKGVTR